VEPPAPAPAPVVTKGKTSKPNAKTSKAAIAKSTKTKSAAGNKGGFKKKQPIRKLNPSAKAQTK
jgi:hypothetical protein